MKPHHKIAFLLALVFLFFTQAHAEEAVDVVIYGESSVDINQSTTVSGGNIVSEADITLGRDIEITGDIFASGNLDLNQNTVIDGSITLGGVISLGRNASYTGSLTEFSTLLPEVFFPSYEGTAGTDDYSLSKNASGTLDAGAYDVVDLAQSTTLTLSGGVYDLNTLTVGRDSRFIIGDTTLITVADSFDFNQNFSVEFGDTSLTAADFIIYVSAESENSIGRNSEFTGLIYIPEGGLDINQSSVLTGAFWAKDMTIDRDTTVEYASGCVAEEEVCDDGEDQDCDGSDLTCDDADQDSDGYSVNEGDCQDSDASINPGASESCDGSDNNCNGSVDEGVGSTFYQDADSDGFGSVGSTQTACSASTGYVSNSTDCNDSSAVSYPGATEICDGLDNNCDGSTDEGVLTTFYQDNDGDGFGAVAETQAACAAPSGYVTDNTDCDDASATVFPSATEIADNGIDEDCDGADLNSLDVDDDGDGYSENAGDCNDADATLSPGTTETCDGIDNNCDSSADEGLSDCVDGVPVDLPDDPIDVATELDTTAATTTAAAIEFLYTGTDPIQTGVDADTIDATRAAVVRGLVYDDVGDTLYGVTIRVLNHDEFGQTLSREDGSFDLALNGGGLVTLVYEKDGYLPTQRQIEAPWQDYVWAPVVYLKALDTTATTVTLESTEAQVAQGSLSTDDTGSRSATVLFPSGTTAELVMADGSTQTITEPLVVRATEYTVGAAGELTMPATLPANSGYTYAVELSVDEAITAGASSVEFNQTLYFYVDNFLDFPVGSDVPVGFYDKDLGAWVPSDDGVIIAILGDTSGDGVTEISVSATGTAASSATLTTYGFTSEELVKLTELYAAGTELWRMPVTHFSAWDCNWPFVLASDAREPILANFDNNNDRDKPTKDQCQQAGSIIGCENQTLGEAVDVIGTPFSLVYQSDRVPGRTAAYTTTIPLTDATALPASFAGLTLDVTIAGQHFTQETTATDLNQEYTFTWDGLDGYGRPVVGPQTATIKLGYTYTAEQVAPGTFAQSFGQYSASTTATTDRSRAQGTLWQEIKVNLGTFDARAIGLGGWSLDAHHFYDPDNQELYLGNGTRISAENIPDILVNFAGTGTLGYSGDGGQATAADISPVSLATDANGNLYSGENYYIRRIDPDGVITTIAGTGATSNSGDGGLATSAGIATTNDLAIDKDGNIFILQYASCKIRKIDATTQIISTFAGTGTCGFSGDGGMATAAKLNFPSGIAVDSQGNVYVADTFNYRIRKIDTDGIITTIAGTGFNSDTGDNGQAASARVSLPVGVAVDSQGNIYTNGNLAGTGGRIRKITPAGKISTILYSSNQNTLSIRGITLDKQDNLFLVDYKTSSQTRIYQVDSDGNRTLFAGSGSQTEDFTPATSADFNSINDVVFDASGDLYVADYNTRKIKKIGMPFPRFTSEAILIASTDGKEVYHFDSTGKHQETINALTGEIIYTFSYDATTGLLTGVTDGDGNITTLTRDSMGDITSITAPYGQTTDFALDAEGYVETITNPNGEVTAFTYDNGLMQTFTDAKGNTSTFTYDTDGRLIQDDNAAGGFKSLTRTAGTDGFTVDLTTAEGETNTFTVTTNSDNTTTRTQTDAAGLITTTEIGQDDSKSITYPDGTEVSVETTGDPRFGLQSPILKTQTVTTPGGRTNTTTLTRSVTLDSADELVQQTDTLVVNSKTYTSLFDNTTKEMTQTSPETRTATFTLDTQGRVINTAIPNITDVDFTYTTGLLTQITQGSRVTNLSYNTAGLVDSITNPLSQSTSFTYDNNGQVTQQTLADGRVITYTYDENGNLATLTPPGRPAHSFDYTAVDLTDSYTPPDIGLSSTATNYTYDLDKRLTLITRPDAKTIAFDYDTAGRLETTAINRGSYVYAYATTTGNLSTITDPNGGTLAYTYDGAIPLTTTWTGEVNGSFSRTINNDFLVSTQLVNSADSISFTYDDDNLLTAAGALTLTRDADNGLITATDLIDTTTAHTYTSFGEPSEDSVTTDLGTIYDATYTRDDLGRITTKTETVYGTAITYDYTYDTTGRLTNVTKNTANLATYAYDDNGNRSSYTDELTSTTTTGTYDDQDRLTNYGDNTYTYTDNGELLTKTNTSGTTTYSYDELGNLLSVTLSDGTLIEYVIDGQNRRVGKKVNGSLTAGYLYDGQLRIVAELDSAGSVVSRFVYATKGNVPDYMVQGSTTYRIISDHLGSPRLVVNADTGDLVQQIEYDEFGRVTSDSNSGFQPFGFAGGLYDATTGLVRFGARDYDADAGRWTSKDPIGFAGGDSNLYGYVLSDPVNNFDPSGKDYITFDGDTITIVYENNGKISWKTSWPANSGGSNDASSIPEGTYYTSPNDRESHGDSEGWGPLSYRLHESILTRLFNRIKGHSGGFHIHGGYKPGTAGCVEFKDYAPNQQSLHDFDEAIQSYGKQIEVRVAY